MKRLAILGASGHGKVVADIAELLGWDEINFFDDAWPELTANGTWAVVGNTETLLSRANEYGGVIVAIGANAIRLQKHRQLVRKSAKLISLIHPDAMVSRYASLGLCSVVMAGAVINIDAVVGDACIVNTAATLDHDCQLGDAVHISPGVHLAGGVTVGQASWIGIGACIRQQLRIGDGAMIGAGAVVVCDIPDFVTAVGVPARIVINPAG